MKYTVSAIALATALFILINPVAVSQQKNNIKVKSSEVITGVVIVHVQKDAQSFDLQCNEGTFSCKPLSGGSYTMVELPKGYGMYDCKNIEIYQGDSDKPGSGEKVGAYCLVEK